MIEYLIVQNDGGSLRRNNPSIGTLINEAAANGWRYVDTMHVASYSSHRDFTILMSKEVQDGQ